MDLVLIDDVGTIWDGRSKRLRQAFEAPLSNDEYSSYVVKNLGFIAVNLYGTSCEIRLRPRLVSAKSMASLVDWLGMRQFARTVTVHFDTDWRYNLHTSVVAALSVLHNLLSAERQAGFGDYIMRPLSQSELPRSTQMHKALHHLIDNWTSLSQAANRSTLNTYIQDCLQGRYTIVDAKSDASELTYREVGRGFFSYSDDWVERTHGLSVEKLEDAAYGRWAAAGYRDALRNGVPTICDVDAIMQTPRLGRARLRYKRVLFPARSGAGGSWLLTSSIIDPTIDLRFDLLKKSA